MLNVSLYSLRFVALLLNTLAALNFPFQSPPSAVTAFINSLRSMYTWLQKLNENIIVFKIVWLFYLKANPEVSHKHVDASP